MANNEPCEPAHKRKPDWIRIRVPGGDGFKKISDILKYNKLYTICEEGRCPNRGECWTLGEATFLILGNTCTRSCRFCAVNKAKEGSPLRQNEGEAIANAAREMGLSYVVLSSVDRDDLKDRGAGQFASCIKALRGLPHIKIEVLIPDYSLKELKPIMESPPDVVAHNIEVPRPLQWIRDSRSSFDKSLATLREAKEAFLFTGKNRLITKSSILLGLGEEKKDVLSAMDELRLAGVDILVLGQYLQPTHKELKVISYISPSQFEEYKKAALERGFGAVIASPLARTSYHAGKSYHECL